jgi:hypothetical protein
MKKPRIEAFDPNHTDTLAESFANLPQILPQQERHLPKPQPAQLAPPVKPAREPKLPSLPEDAADTVLLDIKQTGSEQRSIRITLAEKRALQDLCTRLDREFGIQTDITHLLRAGGMLILSLMQQRIPAADLEVVVRLLQTGKL